MAANVCQRVCSEIKQSTLHASIQLDESTDSAIESHLITFARYEKDKKIKEKFLFRNTLSTTTAADVKALVDSFFEANELSWQNFKHICTDGAPAMIGIKSGFVTLVKNEWSHVTSSHCSLHLYTLASKTLISTFDGSYGRCGQSDRLHSFESSSNFWSKKWERNICDFGFTQKAVGCREANASLSCMNLKMRMKSFSRKQKQLPSPISQ